MGTLEPTETEPTESEPAGAFYLRHRQLIALLSAGPVRRPLALACGSRRRLPAAADRCPAAEQETVQHLCLPLTQ
jgi:hypothetical protein